MGLDLAWCDAWCLPWCDAWCLPNYCILDSCAKVNHAKKINFVDSRHIGFQEQIATAHYILNGLAPHHPKAGSGIWGGGPSSKPHTRHTRGPDMHAGPVGQGKPRLCARAPLPLLPAPREGSRPGATARWGRQVRVRHASRSAGRSTPRQPSTAPDRTVRAGSDRPRRSGDRAPGQGPPAAAPSARRECGAGKAVGRRGTGWSRVRAEPGGGGADWEAP